MDADIIIRVVSVLTVLAAAIYLGNLAAEKFAYGVEKSSGDYGTIAPLPGHSQSLPPNISPTHMPSLPVNSSSTPNPVTLPPPTTTGPTTTGPTPSLPPAPTPSLPPVMQPTPPSTQPPQTSGDAWATIVDWHFPGDDLTRFGSA